jgi:glycosyltransferase involved in cell wall biosynthesis
MIQIVTAASRTHSASVKALLHSAKAFGHRVILFDLGLDLLDSNAIQTEFFGQSSFGQLVPFMQALCERNINISKNAGDYKWKSLAISHSLQLIQQDVRFLLWLDAGNLIVGDLKELLSQIQRYGVYTPSSSGTIESWTHAATIQALQVEPSLLKLPNRNGALIGFDLAQNLAMRFIEEWSQLCSITELIAPVGSSRSNHRQDQALLTILWYRYMVRRGVKSIPIEKYNNYHGIIIHQDIDCLPTSDLHSRTNSFLQEEYLTKSYFAKLFRKPTPHPMREAPSFHVVSTSSDVPKITIVTPVFNSIEVFKRTLPSWLASASLPFDLIVIDDGSNVDEQFELKDLLHGVASQHKLKDVLIVQNKIPIFETASENLGYYLARTEFVVSIQADIEVLESGFDSLLINALSNVRRPIAASGRCGHPLRWVFTDERRDTDTAAGLYDMRIAWDDELLITPILSNGNRFDVQTVNRGPLAFRKKDLEVLGFLDERHFFLGNDDHEFILRARLSLQRLPVYVPMRIRSNISDGPSRRERTGLNKQVFEYLMNRPKSAFFEIVGRSLGA